MLKKIKLYFESDRAFAPPFTHTNTYLVFLTAEYPQNDVITLKIGTCVLKEKCLATTCCRSVLHVFAFCVVLTLNESFCSFIPEVEIKQQAKETLK